MEQLFCLPKAAELARAPLISVDGNRELPSYWICSHQLARANRSNYLVTSERSTFKIHNFDPAFMPSCY